MTSGGHARSGPAPDPYALHRGDKAGQGWTRLTDPTGPPPNWPLGDQSEREAAIWQDLWSRPQATAWPRYNLVREVAAYSRALALFEEKPHAALGTLLRRLADDLGLTIPGAARNRWLLPDENAPAGAPATVTRIRRGATATGHRSSRERFPRFAPPSSSAEDRAHDD
ncbi:UNVERIFIED_ORG: hypothetical protein E4P37_07920 [Bacillus sp. AZ43]